MSDIADLISKVHSGEVPLSELSLDEAEEVLAGYKQVAELFCQSEATRGLGEAILQIIAQTEDTDPFEVAIEQAQARGSTYWELETNSIH